MTEEEQELLDIIQAANPLANVDHVLDHFRSVENETPFDLDEVAPDGE